MHTRQGVGVAPASLHNTPRISADGMYPKAFTRSGFSKHSHQCKAAFGRHDTKCHRCVELILGATPRDGWQHNYFAKKLGQLQRRFEF